MKSVGNIAKITKAMKMVAASRLRGVQTRMEQSRGLPVPFLKLLGDQPGALLPASVRAERSFSFLLPPGSR
jgi:F-type H+-transporting ATPase subunit gamma